MLTYETLRKIMFDEKKSNRLLKLPENFFEEAKSYLENKAKFASGKEDIWELDSAKRVIQDLMEIREGKLVRSGAAPDDLTREEKSFFDSVAGSIRQFQGQQKEIFEGKKEPMQVVAFLETIPQFVGIDMRNYGPFEKGDIATVPVANARLLVEKGSAKQINTDK
jgi:DNA replication initiation complex subunit (GINS family)